MNGRDEPCCFRTYNTDDHHPQTDAINIRTYIELNFPQASISDVAVCLVATKGLFKKAKLQSASVSTIKRMARSFTRNSSSLESVTFHGEVYPLSLMDTTDLVVQEAKLLFGDIDSLISIGPGRVDHQDIDHLLRLEGRTPHRKSIHSSVMSTDDVVQHLDLKYHEIIEKVPLEVYRRLEPGSVPNVGPNDFLSIKQVCDVTNAFLEQARLSHALPLLIGRGSQQALNWAACTRNNEVVKRLLSQMRCSSAPQDFELNWNDDYGYTALHWAARNGHSDIVSELLHQSGIGVDAVVKTKSRNSTSDTVHNKEIKLGTTPLHLAIEHGHCGVVSSLLAKRADIAAVAENGKTTLHIASVHGAELMLETVESSIKGMAEMKRFLEERTPDGKTALHLAVEANNTHAVRCLLRNGADPQAETTYGWKAIHLATETLDEDLLRILVEEYQVDVNARADGGKTALHVAAERGHAEVARALLGLGADIFLEDQNGNTAWDFAFGEGEARDIQRS